MNPQQIHLIVVGVILVLVLTLYSVFLRKLSPRYWWFWLLLTAILPVLIPVAVGFLH